MNHDLPTAIGVGIVAAAAFALIARWLRQPPIFGYIAGGVVLGPHVGLGLVHGRRSIEVDVGVGLISSSSSSVSRSACPRSFAPGARSSCSGLPQFPHLRGPRLVGLQRPRGCGRGLARWVCTLAVALSLSSHADRGEVAHRQVRDPPRSGGKVTLGSYLAGPVGHRVHGAEPQPGSTCGRVGFLRSFAAGALSRREPPPFSRGSCSPRSSGALAGSHAAAC